MYQINDSLTEGLYSEIMCPHCGAKCFEEKYTSTTLIYVPKVFKNGKLVQTSNPNVSTTYCRCLKCGKDFEFGTSWRTK